MAINKVREINEVRVVPEPPKDGAMPDIDGCVVSGYYTFTIDDPNDDELPIVTQKHFALYKGDDVSGHDPLVQTICNAVWAE